MGAAMTSDKTNPTALADTDLDAATGGTGGRDVEPVRIMKRIDQTTPLAAADDKGGETYTTCSCTHL